MITRLSSSTLSGVLVIPMSLPKNPNDNREMLTSTMAVVLIKIFLYVSHFKKREKFVKIAVKNCKRKKKKNCCYYQKLSKKIVVHTTHGNIP